MDAAQRAKLKGSVNALTENGTTATWDATLVALDMLLKKQKEIPDAKLMLFVMSDGETNEGVKIDKLEEIMSAFDVPIYTVMFNGENDDMKRVAELNEGSAINAVGDNLSNKLRELFNVQM
jgi:Ca-activated chloride channel family protein